MNDPDLRRRVDAIKQRVALSALIGGAVKLTRRGSEHVGLCPFHSEGTPSFTVVDGKGFYHCFGCGAHGDAIRFTMEHDGKDFIGALEALEQDGGLFEASARVQREAPTRDRGRSDLVDPRKAAAWVWQQAQCARGELPEAWLKARGIDPNSNGLLDVARYHPDCPAQLWRTFEGPDGARRRAGALVCPILRITGPRGAREFSLIGVHLTFLSADGREKAKFQPWRNRGGEWVHPPTRVMWGGSARGAVPVPCRPTASGYLRPGAGELLAEITRLIDDVDAGPLLVGEGVESTCSLMGVRPDARIGFATLSLGNLQGRAAKAGPHDSLQLWNVTGDPDGPPFTIIEPGKVVVGVDADMKPTAPQWVQDRPKEAAVKRALNGRERAELCGKLAAWHWREAGAARVSVVRPLMGDDFNDVGRAQVAAGGSAEKNQRRAA